MTKIAILQLNPTVGDIEGNRKMIFDAYMEAVQNGADIAVAPECVLTGYPLEDLVLRESFMDGVVDAVADLHEDVLAAGRAGHKTVLIFGTPYPDSQMDGVNNTVWKIDPTQETIQMNCKWELPNYGVFDEKRVFIRNDSKTGTVFDIHGAKVGVMICEDAWFPKVSRDLAQGGASMLISINGSPFEFGKNHTRRDVVRERVRETGLPFLYVNLVGGQDELVFDGGSFFYDGKSVQEFPYFETGIFYVETDLPLGAYRPEHGPRITLDNYTDVEPSGIEAIYRACVLGLRDYVTKQGFKSVLLGYSGGVDSGIVAAMACDALGAENVLLVRLPSKYSSEGSLTDAAEGAKRLGTQMRTIQIEPVVEALRNAYSSSFNDRILLPTLTGTADENIQARARGNILMAISNQEGHMLLTTGNKSEVSVGYSTLYGDMSGGFNPIKDCYKVTVWELCRWRNALTSGQIRDFGFKGAATEVVPEAIIVKPPSAELRPDQKDEDSLPPYPVLDTILKAMIEDEKSILDIVNENGYDEPVVRRVRNLLDNAEYKRRQAAPGVKITSRLHGRERRYPIINRWRG